MRFNVTLVQALIICAFLGASLHSAGQATKKSQAKLSPAEKVQHQKWQKYLSDPAGPYAYYPKEMCGKDFPITLDPAVTPAFMKAGNDASLYCEEIRSKLSTMCRNAESLGNNNKKKITKLINKITCTLGKGDEASFKIVAGNLQASLGPKASNISEKLLAFLDSTPE